MPECGEVEAESAAEEARAERERADRVENYYQQSAWELAERIVELEDELGADVDGICTGMHADVAEAHAEIERLTSESRKLEGDCIRLSEERDDARAANVELSKYVRDGAHWEGVADRMRAEIGRLTGNVAELQTELATSKRDADAGWEHAQKADDNAQEWATSWKFMFNDRARILRYRLAWLSARRRAADEANMGAEAVDHIRRDRDRWRSGHETAEAQLVRERRENERLRAFADEVTHIRGWCMAGDVYRSHLTPIYEALQELDEAQRERRPFRARLERQAIRGDFDEVTE